MKWMNKGHEFDAFVGEMKKKNNLYLYGIGGNAEELIEAIMFMKWAVPWNVILVDKDARKQRDGFIGQSIISPADFCANITVDDMVCICPEGKAGKEIKKICSSLNINMQYIFDGLSFLHKILPVFITYSTQKVFFASINMLPSTVCNLNCRDCLNFTPYIENHAIKDLIKLKDSVDVFFGAVDYIYRFQITGGEPLLYKSLKELISYIDFKYRDRIFSFEMVTNGTISPSEEICEVLREKKIKVFLDDYRMSVPDGECKYQKVKALFDKFHVNYVDNHVDKWIRMYTEKEYQRTEGELIDLFKQCGNVWSTLCDGKISSCNYAAYAHTAGLCEDDENEYFDLRNFNLEKQRELIEFRVGYSKKGYTNFCKMCNGWTSINKKRCKPAIQEGKI